MPSINLNDLNNAKLDVDHIAAVATSSASTVVDRFGVAKDTVKGAVDSLKAFNSRGAWAASIAYAIKDVVMSGGTWYACVAAHTSSAAFATDSASKWRVHQGATTADLGAGGIPVFAVGTPAPGVSSQFFASKAISTHAQYGFLDNSQINYVAAGFQAHASFNDNVTISGTQASDHHHSFQSYPHFTSSGALGRLSSFWSQLEHTGSGTVAQAMIFNANNPLGTGPITTLYGMYIGPMTRGTTNWAIYADGIAPSFLGGGVLFGQIGNPVSIKYNTSTGNIDISPRAGYGTVIKSGNLVVGTEAAFAGEVMTVIGSVANFAHRLYNSHASAPKGIAIIYPAAAPNSVDSDFIYCQDSNAIRMKVQSNGNVVNVNNSYGALSDEKLKTDITDATPKLADLMRVRVAAYNMRTDPTRRQLGVIAQELESVFPSMVEATVDRDKNGVDKGTVTKSVKYSVFVPMLIKAIQEQQSQIDALREKVSALSASK
jgi:hypothetical protein